LKHALQQQPVTRQYAVVLHPHRIRLRDIPERERVFFFLRDPVRRFISGFYSRQRQGQPRIFSPWSEEEREAFRLFHTPNELALSLSAGRREEKTAAERAMRSIQHVRDSYWYWFESQEYFLRRRQDILFIGRQESLAEDFELLKQALGVSARLSLPSDDLSAHRNPPHLDTHLEEAAVRNLEEWYQADYRFLELCARAALQG